MLVDLEIVLDSANLTWAHGILLGLTCLSLLAVTINRWMRWKSAPKKAKKISLLKVDVPFSVSLTGNGFEVAVKSSVMTRVEIYWDFQLNEFYTTLKKRWFNDELVMNAWLCGTFITEQFDASEKVFTLNEEDVVKHSIPRPSFLVAVFVRNLNKIVRHKDVLGLISVIDLGDVTHPSSNRPKIIGRYLKLGSGYVTTLQRFFPSGLNQDNNTTDICVVCRDSPVTRVVLPCRHACFCSECFQRVSTCSMCTADILSYFCIEPSIEDVD